MNALLNRLANFRSLRPMLFRGAGYIAIAAALVTGMFFASQRSLAALDEENHRARAEMIDAPAPGGNNLITVTLRTSAIDLPAGGTPIEMRAGVAYDDRIAYWRDAIPLIGTNGLESIDTAVASRDSGEVIVALGPLPAGSTSAQPAPSDSIRGAIVWIEDKAYAIVHRKAVENLMEVKSRQGVAVAFAESTVGVRGEIELRPAS